jgi:predicted dehydrogenase
MEDRLRIAVLGCGSIGRRHLQNLLTLNQSECLAYDPIPATCQAVAAEFKVRCHARLQAVWDERPDAVIVTSPSHTHVELALAAVRHDCNIFVEKPLSNSMKKVGLLESEVRERKRVAMVACNMRFHPGPAMVKQLIDKGAIGQILAARIQSGSYLPRWRPWQDYRQSYSASPSLGGALLDCIHEIDLALWYFGAAKLVGAALLPADSIGLETDGLAEILLRHDSGVLSSVHVNFVQRDYRRTCEVIGSAGTIYWDFNAHQVKVYGTEGTVTRTFPEPDQWDLNQMYLDEISYFLRCVQTQTCPINSIQDGRAALRIAVAAKHVKQKESQ